MSVSAPSDDRSDQHAADATRLLDVDQRCMLIDELGRDILAELEASFWNDYAALFARAAAATAARDRAEFGDTVHTIKGAASNLGFAGIATAAADLRAAVVAGDWPDLADLQRQAERTRAALAAAAGQG